MDLEGRYARNRIIAMGILLILATGGMYVFQQLYDPGNDSLVMVALCACILMFSGFLTMLAGLLLAFHIFRILVQNESERQAALIRSKS